MSIAAALLLIAAIVGASPQPVQPPQLLGEPPPLVNPLSADEATAMGIVVVPLLLSINEQGDVDDVTPTTPAGDPRFLEAAIRYARALHFAPALQGTRPTRVQLPLTLTYEPPPQAERHSDHEHAATDGPRPPVHVDDVEPHTEPEPPPPAVGEPIAPNSTVRAQKVRTPTAISDMTITPGALLRVPRKTARELLTLAPGVMLQNHGGDGHPESILLRGFDAGEGQDLAISIDGVPMNEVSAAEGHGFADTGMVMPSLVRSLRVTEGPFRPELGDFAVAGAVDYEIGKPTTGLDVTMSYGSFNTARLEASYAPQSWPDAFVGLQLRRSDGFGPNRSSQAGGGMAGATVRLGDEASLRTIIAIMATTFDSAGVVREDDLRTKSLPCAQDEEAQFFCSYDARQGGASQRALLSTTLKLNLEHGVLTQQLYAVVRNNRATENFTGFLLDPPALQGSQRGDLTEFSTGGFTTGGRIIYRNKLDWFGASQDFEVGLTARHDQVSSSARLLRDEDGAPYRTTFDHDAAVTNLGTYAQLRLAPVPYLWVIGGVRVDGYFFAIHDFNQNSSDRQGARLTDARFDANGFAVQPRLSSSLRLWRDDDGNSLVWQTSLGLGNRSTDAASLAQGQQAPFSEVRAGETGLSWQWRPAQLLDAPIVVDARSAAFSTTVLRDLVFDPASARNINAGTSWRFGVYGQVRSSWGEHIDAQVGATWTEAYLVDPPRTWLSERLPYIPRLLIRADVTGGHRFNIANEDIFVTGSGGMTFMAPRPIPLNQWSEPIFLADAALRGRWRLAELGVIVTNLLDARWQQASFNYPSNFRDPTLAPSLVAANHFVAGAPRTIALELTVHLDG